MAERNHDVPLLKPCDGSCGCWLASGDGQVIGQVELGPNMGIYRDVVVCSDCASKRKPAVQTKDVKPPAKAAAPTA
jgi:hypothetical protein